MSAADFPIFDVHTHTQPSVEAAELFFRRNQIDPAGRRGTVEHLFEQMDAAGVVRAMIVSWLPAAELVQEAVDAGQDADAARQSVVAQWRELNAWAVAAVRDNPERLGCFVGLDPVLMGAELTRREARAGLAAGATGLKVAPMSVHKPADGPELELIWQLAVEHDVPVLTESGDLSASGRGDYGHPRRFVQVVRSYPGLRLQMAHLGLFAEADTATVLQTSENVVTDTAMRLGASVTPEYTPERFAALLRRLGTDRVVFGTNFPLIDQRQHAAELRGLPLTDEEKYAIAYGNAARFFRLPLRE